MSFIGLLLPQQQSSVHITLSERGNQSSGATFGHHAVCSELGNATQKNAIEKAANAQQVFPFRCWKFVQIHKIWFVSNDQGTRAKEEVRDGYPLNTSKRKNKISTYFALLIKLVTRSFSTVLPRDQETFSKQISGQ